jgi:hypothetical protein
MVLTNHGLIEGTEHATVSFVRLIITTVALRLHHCTIVDWWLACLFLLFSLQGWYLPEMAHPYFKFRTADFNIDVCSVSGGATTCTPASIDLNDAENKLFWETPETKALTEDTKALSDFDGSKYDCVFYVGGFGTMWYVLKSHLCVCVCVCLFVCIPDTSL